MGTSGSKADSLFQKVKDGTRGKKTTTVQRVNIPCDDNSDSDNEASTSQSHRSSPSDKKDQTSSKVQNKPNTNGIFRDKRNKDKRKNTGRPISSFQTLDVSDSDDVDMESEIIDPGKYSVYKPKTDLDTFHPLEDADTESNLALAGSRMEFSNCNAKPEPAPPPTKPTTIVLGSWTGDCRKVDKRYYGPKTKINVSGTETVKKPQPPHPDLIRKVFHENIYLVDDVNDVEECFYLDDNTNFEASKEVTNSSRPVQAVAKFDPLNRGTFINKKQPDKMSDASLVSHSEEEILQNMACMPNPQSRNILCHKTSSSDERKPPNPELARFQGAITKPSSNGWTNDAARFQGTTTRPNSNRWMTNTPVISHLSATVPMADVESSATAIDKKISDTVKKCVFHKPGTSASSDTWTKQRAVIKKKKPKKQFKTNYTLPGMYQNSCDSSSSSEISDEDNHKSSDKKNATNGAPKQSFETVFRSQMVKSPQSLVRELKEEGIIPLREVHEAREEKRMKHLADVQDLTAKADDPASGRMNLEGAQRPSRLAPISREGGLTDEPSTSLIKQYGLRPSLRSKDNITRGITGSDTSNSS